MNVEVQDEVYVVVRVDVADVVVVGVDVIVDV